MKHILREDDLRPDDRKLLHEIREISKMQVKHSFKRRHSDNYRKLQGFSTLKKRIERGEV